MRFVFTAVAVAGFLVCFCGCKHSFKAYDGPKLRPSEHAVIYGYSSPSIWKGTRVTIWAVDDKTVGNGSRKVADKVFVLPGEHILLILIHAYYHGEDKLFNDDDRVVREFVEIYIKCEAGHKYQINIDNDDDFDGVVDLTDDLPAIAELVKKRRLREKRQF